MFTDSIGRRSVVTMASVTAGLATVVVAPAAANAQPDAGSTVTEQGGAGTAQLGTCQSWSFAEGQFGGVPAFMRIPTTASQNDQRNCLLRLDDNNSGVLRLQDAINRCYPQFAAGVGLDSDYGPNTQRAVKQIQDATGVEVDGVYGPETKTAMDWPAFRQGNGAFIGCGLLRA